MKFLYIIFALFSGFATFSQSTVTIDAGNTLRSLTGIENGIVLDYLMDDSYLSPAISTSQSLKNAHARLLRYPGGEKSDNYLFSAPPYSNASPRMALIDTCFWPTNDYKFVDTNSADRLCWPSALDFDEFMAMCRTTSAEPLIVVAYDAAYNDAICNGKPNKSELIAHAVEWVKYANITRGWNVKYWMIGNESWNDPRYNGKATPIQYADDLEDFASAMKAVDSTIKIIANGRADWWETILTSNAVSLIDILAFSEYPVWNYAGGYDYYHSNNVNLTGEVDQAISAINTHAPAAHKDRLKVLASEYSSVDWSNTWTNINNLGHSLVNFQMFGDMIIKPQVEAACMWNTRWTQNSNIEHNLYDAFDANGSLHATGKVMNVWGSNLLSAMVDAISNDNYIKVYASEDEADRKLNILLLNKDYSDRQVNISLQNFETDFKGSKWEFRGSSVDDKFPFYDRIDSVYEPSDIENIILPANSITVLRLQRDDVVLPLSLVKLEAKKNEDYVLLTWLTENEDKVKEFVVERSEDGLSFTAVGAVPSQNTDSGKYNFFDRKAYNAPIINYRLIVVDNEGNKVSSRVVSVTIGTIPQAFLVHPNPFADVIQLRTKSYDDRKITVIIVDINGKVVRKEDRTLRKGNNIIEINNLQGLRRGMYLLKVGDDTGARIIKLMRG